MTTATPQWPSLFSQPKGRTPYNRRLHEISTSEEHSVLQGKVDAVLVGSAILDAPGAGTALAEFAGW